MTSLKTSIKTITYLSDIGCLEIQGASLLFNYNVTVRDYDKDDFGGDKYHNTKNGFNVSDSSEPY